jgi:hypothetical protein
MLNIRRGKRWRMQRQSFENGMSSLRGSWRSFEEQEERRREQEEHRAREVLQRELQREQEE